MHPYKALYTTSEEIIHGVTHGIGTGLSIAGLTVLVILAIYSGDIWRIVSFTIFGSTLVLLYLASTLYHSIQQRAKQVFSDGSPAVTYFSGHMPPFVGCHSW
jgi:hemolysin III